jgi:hypothetical protein
MGQQPATNPLRRHMNVIYVFLAISVSASAAETISAPVLPVPPSAIELAAVDLRVAPRMIYKTADTIFVVRNDCNTSTPSISTNTRFLILRTDQ